MDRACVSETCTSCGDSLPDRDRHPVTGLDEYGDGDHSSFCDDCRAAWADEQTADGRFTTIFRRGVIGLQRPRWNHCHRFTSDRVTR